MPDKQKKILIIDDEKDLARMASLRLKANGFSVSEAFTAQEGLRKVQEEEPDLILLDVLLPDGDGYEISQRLKSNPETKDIKIIIFTASSQKVFAKQAIAIGAADYVLKPFDPQDLLEKVRKALEPIR